MRYRLLWVDGVGWCESKALSNRHTFVGVCVCVCLCVCILPKLLEGLHRICLRTLGKNNKINKTRRSSWRVQTSAKAGVQSSTISKSVEVSIVHSGVNAHVINWEKKEWCRPAAKRERKKMKCWSDKKKKHFWSFSLSAHLMMSWDWCFVTVLSNKWPRHPLIGERNALGFQVTSM